MMLVSFSWNDEELLLFFLVYAIVMLKTFQKSFQQIVKHKLVIVDINGYSPHYG